MTPRLRNILSFCLLCIFTLYIIPKERIKPITNISAAQTMKFAVSGGVTDVVDHTPFAQAHQEIETTPTA
jgi:uncharacterized membrane protein